MQICDFCEKEIPDHTAVCPHCHKLQMSPGEQRTHGRRIVLVAALTVLTMGVAVAYQYFRHGILPHFG
ncbi:Hypothetical protein RG540_PA09860 (plasmid) [Neorhizobium galegae bv. orientalis str. HAMBI 540]|uniref:Uncharacterized protein n=1 Tax=Neorhizobium galegae bv. orientalis str. HAMBI 540 TaxID=1028800 RepID=A0A068SZN2_NEOGA|nr:Hypothetical protein RG540_PA09860 [Neorhizobium galegae bv. orientalis str. HAMBI 540]